MFRAALAGIVAAVTVSAPAAAATYEIDPAHAMIQWKVQNLGFSFVVGRFNRFEGSFDYDASGDNAAPRVSVVIETASLDSNHAVRDKHLRGPDFLATDRFPTATFESTGFVGDSERGELTGNLTLKGVTQEVVLDVRKIGEGKDPWGGYRAGFEGKTTIDRRDFGLTQDLGPASWLVELELQIEGVRQ